MTTLNDYAALEADHRRLRTAARNAFEFLNRLRSLPDLIELEAVRHALRDALDASAGAGRDAEEDRTVRAAKTLIREGRHHGWWKALGLQDRTLEEMDPIGREEFLDLVARILRSADSAPALPSQGGEATGSAASADENAPLSMDEIVGIFGPTMPTEAAVLIRDNPDGLSIAEIRAELRRMAAAAAYRDRHLPAFLTHDDDGGEHHYYLAPENRHAPPYHRQRHVDAIVDIAADGSFAGVELIDDMPPPYPPAGR